MNQAIENILKVNPYKVELSLVDYQGDGVKLEVFLLDKNYNVIDIFTVSTNRSKSIGDLVNHMVELHEMIQDEGIICECIDGIQKC